jgi:putative ABC transport system permease protein
MIRIFFKTIWNNRRRNILVFIELFMISLIMVNLSVYLVNMITIFRIKNCYDTHNVVLIQIRKKNDEDEKITEQAFQNLKKVIIANPFVKAVSICNSAIPYNYSTWRDGFKHDSDKIYIDPRLVDIDYAKVMNIKPLKGRWFDETDLGKEVIPMTVSKDIEETNFHGDALGKRLENNKITYEVVGVTDRFKRSDIETPDSFGFLFKEKTEAKKYWGADILIRTNDDKTGSMLSVAENQVYSTLNPENWTIESLNSLENMHSQQNAENYQRDYLTVIIALFIMVNVFLGTIGILWYNTNLRINEIGIKRALGATGKGIKRLLISENMILAASGLVIVIIIMVQTPSQIGYGKIEPGVQSISIWVSTGVMILLVLLSTWIPATIASKIRPAVALKTE